MDVFFSLVALLNLLSFALFGIDKYLSRHGMRRISEKRLLMSAWIGGSVGAIVAQRLFRHKTKKFRRILWVILTTQIVLAVLGIWGFGMGFREGSGESPAYLSFAM